MRHEAICLGSAEMLNEVDPIGKAVRKEILWPITIFWRRNIGKNWLTETLNTCLGIGRSLTMWIGSAMKAARMTKATKARTKAHKDTLSSPERWLLQTEWSQEQQADGSWQCREGTCISLAALYLGLADKFTQAQIYAARWARKRQWRNWHRSERGN